ncbi:hypothetical protein [Streptomyces sp. SPB162]|uniref:hypothetical protein n=1 Tax=Streptomyces sp. SPB162 TaxID=2940560 RepID=UPI00240757D0|nr:hypothetical protein [Streptomyces sp. SPB162]MDF9813267.1 hypothetical protein [Streptomyces sp. SPB162]
MSMDQGPARALQLKWELVGHGWARCDLTDDSQTASVIASYCTDALADLVASTGELYGQQHSARFFFDAEPQELRWVLSAVDDAISVTIYKFPDVGVSPDLPDSSGTVIWQSTHPRQVFVHAVLDAADNVLREHGEAGYHAKWSMHQYPFGLVADLRRLHMRDDVCALSHELPCAQARE